MNASEAKQLADDFNNNANSKKIEELEAKIAILAYNGKYFYQFEDKVNNSVKKHFIDLHYAVKVENERDGYSRTTISWA